MPAIGGVAERRYVALLATLFAIIWLGLAVEPRHRADWALENALTILALPLLALTRRRVPLSPLSYTLIFVFLTFHVVGAHYTYSEVPYDAWFASLSGESLNRALGWQRNNFDRNRALLLRPPPDPAGQGGVRPRDRASGLSGLAHRRRPLHLFAGTARPLAPDDIRARAQ